MNKLAKFLRPLVTLLFLLVAIFITYWFFSLRQNRLQLADHQIVRLQIDSKIYQVEVVNTPSSLSQGLGGRTEIGADGMLFILPKKQKAHFWMKDMLLSLDFVWIRNQQVIGITQDVSAPLPGVTEAQLPIYSSPGPVDWVLELPAGRVKEQSIEAGAVVKLLP